MSKNHQIIITSELDENYFIITNGNFYIIELIQLLNKKGINVSTMLSQVITNKELINKKVFIAKDSHLGIELEKLIQAKELNDESKMIRESYLFNALISAVLNDAEQIYIDFIAYLIKEKKFGSIDELKQLHLEDFLHRISYDGRKNCYTKKEIITGFEDEGITYQDNEWVPIKLTTKKLKKVRR